MNGNKRIHLLVVLTLFAGSIAVFVPAAPAQNIKVLEALDQPGIKKSQTPQAHELPKRNN